MEPFASLGVSAPVCRVLTTRGILEPFEIQSLVIADAIAGKDVLAKSRTGSGKTLAFGLPMIERTDLTRKQPSALVLVPTRELAVQVVKELSDVAAARGVRLAAVYGGVGLADQARKAAKAHIVVATPGRLQDLVDRRMLRIDNVKTLVLDEADRMLDMGFQPQVDRIVSHVPREGRQTMFFSATLEGVVGHLARAYTKDAVLHEVESKREVVESANHRFVEVKGGDKVATLISVLEAEPGTAIVFVRTKRGADRLAHRLTKEGVNAVALHGDLTQPARTRALERLMSGKAQVLVATDVAARGLDLDDIAHVVNFDPPGDDSSYVHRVGRTARAGKAGIGTTLVMPEQQADISRMAARLKLHEEFEDGGMEVAPPALVYSSHRGRRSSMRSRPSRRR
ncbi:MAG TPA: DEAD/DEAH box helicase [Actinomycetota bacterium]|nr:DEAD/DEAH box helicase [Actinomycetota bacterium]